MGQDCRIINNDFQNEIDELKARATFKAECSSQIYAEKQLTNLGLEYFSIDEVMQQVEPYSVMAPKNYAFYDDNYALFAYLDIREGILYF